MKKERLPSEETIDEGARKKKIVLEALRYMLPASDVQAWLHAPNPDLGSRTPAEAMAEDDYAPVIEALWLHDTRAGPVS